MLKYRSPQLVRAGAIGMVLIVLVIAVGLQPERLTAWATSVRYQALFSEAGGLDVGNDVIVSGTKVGQVTAMSLDKGKVRVTFTADASVPFGDQSTAQIRTGTLLGERILTLTSAGSGAMRPNDTIPISRTASPYSLSDAVGDLTTDAAGTDAQQLNQSLDTLSETLDRVAPQLGPTFEGLTKVSESLTGRDDSLRELLKSSGHVTGLLAERSAKINSLILNANDLVSVLNERRQAIVVLLANTSVVAEQLSGLVADNEDKLAPALKQLNSVTAMLEKNRDNIAKAMPGLLKYQMAQGESVSNGFYYNANVGNLIPGQFLQPFLDYAFGFRRGTNAGQPPDNAGPRAEFPFPHNGIPGGSR